MASLKYRCLKLNPVVVTVPVAASQYFYHNGINMVDLDGSGHATTLETADTSYYGMAIVPKGQGAGSSDNYWLSSSTAGEDEIQVIVINGNEDATFLLPADTTVSAANNGNAVDFVATNDGTATYVNTSASSTDMMIQVDVGTSVAGGSTTDGVFKFNPAKVQADT